MALEGRPVSSYLLPTAEARLSEHSTPGPQLVQLSAGREEPIKVPASPDSARPSRAAPPGPKAPRTQRTLDNSRNPGPVGGRIPGWWAGPGPVGGQIPGWWADPRSGGQAPVGARRRTPGHVGKRLAPALASPAPCTSRIPVLSYGC